MRDDRHRRMRGTTPELERAARGLRREMTPAERQLWRKLRDHRLGGLSFRRQHPLDQFILDFYCLAHQLAVEVDGAVHDDPTQAERDHARTVQLGALGVRVVRFRNEEVLTDLRSVLARIKMAIREDRNRSGHQSPAPPPERGRVASLSEPGGGLELTTRTDD
jgi:very-short-patch-repair endonuclease